MNPAGGAARLNDAHGAGATAGESPGQLRSMDRRRLEAFLEPLRESGGRLTTPRRVIATAFLDAGGHVTVEELADTVQHSHPEIAVSTVYRTMEALEALGAVEHLHLGHSPAVYHLADAGHHHLICEGCRQVTEIPDSVLTPFTRAIRDEFSFTIDTRHFALPGRCAECSARPGST